MKPETRAIHAGNAPDSASGAVVPPIQLATSFVHGPAGERPDGAEGGHQYQRESHPTQSRLEAAMVALEEGAAALAFATGMAAIHALLASLGHGRRVLIPDDVYSGTRTLAKEFLPALGLRSTRVDMTDRNAIVRALDEPDAAPGDCVWLETPSNPQLKVADIAAIVELAHARKAIVACDNTFATPALQNPLALGADVVMHSLTKYLGGHSDVMGGALVFARADDLHARVAHRRHITGNILAPFSAWLILRGARSLPARLAWHCRNARALAECLAAHPAVEIVHYPGLASHRNHDVAARQMSDFGGMLSFQLKGGREAALRVAGALKLAINATSLGGPETLVEHRASVEGATPHSAQNLLRVSVGLEHPDDLLADFSQALDASAA